MKFYFGLYDSGKYWDTGDLSWEIEDNKIRYLMKSGNNTVKNTKVLADGISVARLAVRLKGLLMLSGQWENNARMSLEVFLLLFLLGLTEKRL